MDKSISISPPKKEYDGWVAMSVGLRQR